MADSKERKGWTHIPTGIPFGVVVLHASISILLERHRIRSMVGFYFAIHKAGRRFNDT